MEVGIFLRLADLLLGLYQLRGYIFLHLLYAYVLELKLSLGFCTIELLLLREGRESFGESSLLLDEAVNQLVRCNFFLGEAFNSLL